jgi:hypothetical protein
VISLTVLLFVVGGLAVAAGGAIAVQRGDRPLQIVDQTLMGWPPVFIALSRVFPALELPVVVAAVLILLRIMWIAARKLRR